MSRSGGSSSNGRAARGGGDSRNECGFCAFGAQYCRSVARSDGDVGLLRLTDFDEKVGKVTVQGWLSKHNFFADGGPGPNPVVACLQCNFENDQCTHVHRQCQEWWEKHRCDVAASQQAQCQEW